jgi:hypothetical protein
MRQNGPDDQRCDRDLDQRPQEAFQHPRLVLERDDVSSNCHHVPAFCLSMIFSEIRYPLFGIML